MSDGPTIPPTDPPATATNPPDATLTSADATVPSPDAATAVAPDDAVVHRVERIIGRLLRVGVVGSLALLILGTSLSFYHHRYGHAYADTRRLVGGSEPGPRTPAAFADGLLDWRGQAFITAGLLLLIATPILRVAVSIVAFAIQRDRAFVAITSVVLALLAASFFLGATH